MLLFNNGAFLVILKEEVGSYRAANNEEEETAQSLRENIQLVHHNQCLAIQRICRGVPDTRRGEIKISSGAVDLANADARTKANKTHRAGREKELKRRRGPMPTATNQHLRSGNAFQVYPCQWRCCCLEWDRSLRSALSQLPYQR
jgi:hypothetical protein